MLLRPEPEKRKALLEVGFEYMTEEYIDGGKIFLSENKRNKVQ